MITRDYRSGAFPRWWGFPNPADGPVARGSIDLCEGRTANSLVAAAAVRPFTTLPTLNWGREAGTSAAFRAANTEKYRAAESWRRLSRPLLTTDGIRSSFIGNETALIYLWQLAEEGR